MVQKTLIILLFAASFCFGQTVSDIGTTCDGTCDYSDPQAWEDATDNDLVTAMAGEKGEMYDDATFTDDTVIAGGTTNATYYRELTAHSSSKHDGTENSGVLFSGESGSVIEPNGEEYFRFSYAEITNFGSAGGSRGGVYNVSASDFCRFSYLIIHDPNSSVGSGNGIYLGNGSDDCLIYRNRINDIDTDAGGDSDRGISASRDNLVYNNTVYGCDIGIDENDSVNDMEVENNVSVGNITADYSASFSTNFLNNIDEDGSGQETTSQTLDGTFFADLNDFFLIAGSDALDTAGDKGSPYDVDITGYTVTGTWDAGAHEYQAPAGGSGSRRWRPQSIVF